MGCGAGQTKHGAQREETGIEPSCLEWRFGAASLMAFRPTRHCAWADAAAQVRLSCGSGRALGKLLQKFQIERDQSASALHDLAREAASLLYGG